MRERLRKAQSETVPPLTHTLSRRVRFEEVDAMGIMWHGRYASWLEDGREEIGRSFGIHYLDFLAHGILVPIKLFHLDFLLPLRYGLAYSLKTELLFSESALLEFRYTFFDQNGACTTYARTTQLMVEEKGSLLLSQPAFYQDFCTRWRNGTLERKRSTVPA